MRRKRIDTTPRVTRQAKPDAVPRVAMTHHSEAVAKHTRRVCVIEINRYDWPHSQAICFRPMPTLKPRWFTRTIMVHTTGNVNHLENA